MTIPIGELRIECHMTNPPRPIAACVWADGKIISVVPLASLETVWLSYITLKQDGDRHAIGSGGDCLHPDWAGVGRVHDWRNYISEDLRAMWHTFTRKQKVAIAGSADGMASAEDWE